MAKRTIADLNIKLGAHTASLRKDFDQASGYARRFGGSVDSMGSRVTASVNRIVGALGTLVASFSAVAGARWAIGLAAEAETAQTAFATILQSVDQATALLEKLKAFSASTPFQLTDLRDSSQVLLAFGVTAERIMRVIKTLGDLAAGSGARIAELTRIYGKSFATQRVELETINQFAERGIPLYKVLSEQLGKSAAEIRQMASRGKLSFQQLETALVSMTSRGGVFFAAMESQSRTLAGRWSTLKDNVALLATKIGEKLAPAAGRLVERLTNLVQWLGNLDATTVGNTAKVVAFTAAFSATLVLIPKIVAGVRTIVAALKAMATAQAVTSALSGPAGWARLAASAGVAAIAVAGVSQAFDDIDQQSNTAATAAASSAKQIKANFDGAAETVEETAKALRTVGDTLDELRRRGDQIQKSLRTPLEEYRDAMAELHKLAGLGVINGETFARGARKAREEYEAAHAAVKGIGRAASESRGVAAVQAGTSAGFSAVQAVMRQARASYNLDRSRNKKLDSMSLTLRAIEAKEPIKVVKRRI